MLLVPYKRGNGKLPCPFSHVRIQREICNWKEGPPDHAGVLISDLQSTEMGATFFGVYGVGGNVRPQVLSLARTEFQAKNSSAISLFSLL